MTRKSDSWDIVWTMCFESQVGETKSNWKVLMPWKLPIERDILDRKYH